MKVHNSTIFFQTIRVFKRFSESEFDSMEFLLKLSQKKIEIFIGNYGLKETIGFVQYILTINP
jgi:hypothetical protein